MGPLGSLASLWKHRNTAVGWCFRDTKCYDDIWFAGIGTHHVDAVFCLAEDHKVGHPKWPCDSHKVLQHILLPNLAKEQHRTAQVYRGLLNIDCVYTTPAVILEIHLIVVPGSSVRLLWRQKSLSNQVEVNHHLSQISLYYWSESTYLKLCRFIKTCFIIITFRKQTFSDSAVYGIMTFLMSWMSWPTFFPTWPRLKTKECGTEPNVSSATWFAVARDFFWFLL